MLNLMLCIAALPDLIAKCKHMWGYVQPDVVSDRIYLTLIYLNLMLWISWPDMVHMWCYVQPYVVCDRIYLTWESQRPLL